MRKGTFPDMLSTFLINHGNGPLFWLPSLFAPFGTSRSVTIAIPSSERNFVTRMLEFGA